MAELLSFDPLEPLLPETIGTCRLSLLPPVRMTLIAPFRGQIGAVDTALRGLGLGFPPPNRMLRGASGAILWWGREAAMLQGPPAPEELGAAVVDQTDGWAGLRLEGPAHVDVLARLVPLDLRLGAFGIGAVARTLLGQIPLAAARTEPEAVDLYIPRSMARSGVEDIVTAMARVAARP